MKYSSVAVALASAAFAISGCGDGPTAETGPIVGAWAAVSIDGATLPTSFEVLLEERVCVITVSAVTLEFNTNGRYTGGDTVSRRCGADPAVDLSRGYNGSFRTSGTLLYLREGTSPELPSTYSITGSTLTIVEVGEGGAVTVLQRR